ncbi:Leucine-rich repeat-containing protein 23 [Taenia crassiceps]|uniref:Leucine-rich repeat-containing protein 23 n=1 Tax=Taenia crassiceps TaxID=6207 RepID=A0ABR4Q4Z3_9CEST
MGTVSSRDRQNDSGQKCPRIEIVDSRGDPTCGGIAQPLGTGQIVAKVDSGEAGGKYLFEVDLSTVTNSYSGSNETLGTFDTTHFETLPIAPPPSSPVATPIPRKRATEPENVCEFGEVSANWSSSCPNSTLGVFRLNNGDYILSMLIHQYGEDQRLWRQWHKRIDRTMRGLEKSCKCRITICVSRGITDIAVLQNFQFLRFVTLSHNYISDISPIFAAEYLTYLKADHNRIVKAGNAKSLPYLQFLDLSHNKLTCTDYINHGRLKHLILSYNEITTLKGVEGPPLNQFKLRSLETLELRGNRITSSEGLGDLHNLKTLYFSENLLRSVEGISSMAGLTRLHLRDNNIRCLDGFLQGLPNLLYLNLRKSNKTLVRGKKLTPLFALQILVLSDNPVADRDHYRPIVLGIMPQLQRLDKDKTSPNEIEEAVYFYEKLANTFLEDDEEEVEQEDKAAELISEGKLDELMEEGMMGKDAAELFAEEGGDEEMDNEGED